MLYTKGPEGAPVVPESLFKDEFGDQKFPINPLFRPLSGSLECILYTVFFP